MKRFSVFTLLLLCGVWLLNSCKKETDDTGEPEPPAGDTRIFPKKELRAVWITTAWGLDWPQGDYNAESQKQQYIAYLNRFKELHINTIYFQVKGMGDAFYPSPYEPWSVAVTGTRGKDP